ncbi:MAG TPA: AsmA family protein [Devosia sp.]|nr:AsmA family protein [Devosia sp.]
MLNRLYIVIGVLAILVLGAAFIVPRLIPWGEYRVRMEQLAGEALGADVRIRGDIGFSLLPAPHLVLNDVSVGPASQPVASVGTADADFSLMDFLRDRYTMTRLVLDRPVVELKLEPNGSIDTGLRPPGAESKTSLSVANARIEAGALKLIDVASGRQYGVDGLQGDLTLGSIAGPFSYSGVGNVDGRHLTLKLNAGLFNAAGQSSVSLLAESDGGLASLNVSGQLTGGAAPHFAGDVSYRRSVPKAANPNGVIGDLTLTGKLDSSTQQATISELTLTPDENRAVSQLQGSATVTFTGTPGFAATLVGGVLSLPPRDATAEQGPQPYELVRMLGEIPALGLSPLPGTITANIAQLDLRAASLRNVQAAVVATDKGWTIQSLTGQLPGGASVALAGDLTASNGQPSFAGTFSVATDRLDSLAALWRKPDADNPLFGMPGRFDCKVSLSGQTMALTDGKLTLDGQVHALTALVNFGDKRRVDLSGQFGTLDAAHSAALLALIPDFTADSSAAVTFPEGAVALSADAASLFGLDGKKLAIEGKWGGGSIQLSKFSADDLGGAKLDLALTLSGSLTAPRIAGDGSVAFGAGGGPALDMLFDRFGTPAAARQFLARSLPADLKLHLDDPDGGGGQGVTVSGKAGVADVTFVAKLDGGLAAALSQPVEATLNLESDDPRGLSSQLGLGDVSPVAESGPTRLTLSLKGRPSGSMATSLSLTGGDDSIAFAGDSTPGDLAGLGATGKVTAALSDSSVLAGDLGLDGIHTPPLRGSADLKLATDGTLSLDNVAGQSGDGHFSGHFSISPTPDGRTVNGALSLDSLDVTGLVGLVGGGPTALMKSQGKTLPDGPLSIGDEARPSSGSVAVTVPAISRGGQPFLTDAGFSFDWDATNTSIHKLRARLGGGTLALDLNLCCAGPASDKQLGGEGSLAGVPLSAVLPPKAAATLSGTLDGSVRFSGSGDSIEALAQGLGGDGSFSVSNLSIANFNPAVFKSVAAINDVLGIDPASLTARVATALGQGTFAVPRLQGGFTIAAGTLRVANVGAAAGGAKLFGGASVRLADLGLAGSFALTPTGPADAAGLVNESTSINANLSGSLAAPVRTLDIADMVDSIKMKALQQEVTRLEALKAADDARNRAATAEQKTLREEQAARDLAAQQAAQKAAADAAAKAAADAAAAKAAADAQTAKATPASSPAPASPPTASSQPAAAPAASPAPVPAPRPAPAPLDLHMPPAPTVQFGGTAAQ